MTVLYHRCDAIADMQQLAGRKMRSCFAQGSYRGLFTQADRDLFRAQFKESVDGQRIARALRLK